MVSDKKVAVKVKGRFKKRVLKPVMLFCLQMVSLTKGQEEELEVAKLKILRFSLEITRIESTGWIFGKKNVKTNALNTFLTLHP